MRQNAKNEKNLPKEINSKGAIKTIFERKSVREYSSRKVSKDTLDILIRAAMCAPSAGNRQPWSYVIVTSRQVLNKLASGLPYAKMLTDASAAIIVCGRPEDGYEGKESQFWILDCATSGENILIAAESIGLGACWTGVFPIKERINFVKTTLGIPDDVVPVNVMPIGYPSGIQLAKDKYKPEKVHWEKW